MTKRLRVATIGAGYFSNYQYEAWKRMEDVELVAICNRTEEKGREFAKQYDIPGVYSELPKLLDEVKPDVVDIITPPETHLIYIQEIAKRGIPMICQKPFTPNLAMAKEAIQTAEEGGAKLIIHENFRFQPWFREARRLLADGAIGEPYEIAFRMRTGDGQGPEAYLKRQPYFQKMPRFLIHETGIHYVDTFRSIFGEVKSVYAELRRLNPVISGEDAGFVLFEFENNTRGLYDGNRLVEHDADDQRVTFGEMVLEGSDAVLRLDGYGKLFLRKKGGKEIEIQYEWQNRGFCGDCVYLIQRYIVDHFLCDVPMINTGKEYLRNLQIEEAIYESNEKQCRIEV